MWELSYMWVGSSGLSSSSSGSSGVGVGEVEGLVVENVVRITNNKVDS